MRARNFKSSDASCNASIGQLKEALDAGRLHMQCFLLSVGGHSPGKQAPAAWNNANSSKRYIGQDMQLLHRFLPPPLKQTPHARAFSVSTGRSIPAQRGTIPIVRQATRKNTYPVHRCRPCLSRIACPRSCGCGTSIAACQLSGQQGGSRMPASEEQSELDR